MKINVKTTHDTHYLTLVSEYASLEAMQKGENPVVTHTLNETSDNE